MESVSIPTTKLPLNALTPHPENYNSHSDGQIKELAESLTTFGQFKNIVVWTCSENITLENGLQLHEGLTYILAGHGLWQAAMEAGLDELEVKDYSGLSYEMALTLLMTDNAAPLGSEPIPEKLASLMSKTRQLVADRPGLSAMLARLKERAGLNGAGTGSDGKESPEPQIDKAKELAELWGTKTGQIWSLGEHRLAVGDCTDKATVEALMANERSEIVFTSPPYSNQRQYNNNSDLSIPYLAQIFQVYRPFTKYFVINLGLKHQGDEIDTYWDEWIGFAKQAGLKLLSWNVWDKINATSVKTQMAMFALQHEWIFVFGDEVKPLNRTWEKSPESAKREKYYRFNDRGQKVTTRRQPDGSVSESIIGNIYENKQLGTVITHYAEMARDINAHPAMFPVELPYTYIEAMTNEGGIVIEPFSGSGTTIIAGQQLGRKVRAVEIDPGYAAVSLQRFFEATGIEPTLINST